MVKSYESTEKLFNHNGLKILHPKKAVVYVEDNGNYYIDVEAGLEDLEYLQEGMIIRVNTRWGEQGFRLTNPKKKNNTITVRGFHLWKDSSRYVIVNSYVSEKNCNDALDHLKSACDQEPPFNTISDVTNINSTRIVRKSFEEAINVLIEKWGGHIHRDNWTIGIKTKIGLDRGMVIKYGKNTTNIEATENWDDVVTKLLPVGTDGLTLPETYLYSNLEYTIPYTKVIKFEQDIKEEEFKDENGEFDEEGYKEALTEDLRNQAESYLLNNQYFKCNYKLKAKTDEIVDLGDTIVVQHQKSGIDITTNVISLKYDCIQDKYIEIEFGNFKNKLNSLIPTITNNTEKQITEANEVVKVTLRTDLEEATAKIWGKLGDSYVIYEGDKILIVDTLPKEEATNVMMINSAGIGFSDTGINGIFNSAWLIDGTMDMQVINCINMTATLIKGGTLKLGSEMNGAGKIEIFDISNTLIGTFDENGICTYGSDGSRIVISPMEFTGYDSTNNKVFWLNGDEFHMKKSVVEEEITLCNIARWLGIDTEENTGIGIVPLT